MWSITVKLMKHNLRMLVPAGIAIVIGSAFIACTFLFGNAMNVSLSKQVTAAYGDANYVVMPSPSNDNNDTVAALQLSKLRAVDGVRGARPDIDAGVLVRVADRQASTVSVVGAADKATLPVHVVDGSVPDTGSDGIALPRVVADQLHVVPGDAVSLTSVVTDASGIDAQVTGITDDPNGAYSYYNGAAVASEALMAELYGVRALDDVPNPNRVYLDIDPAKADSATTAVERILGENYFVQSREQAAKEGVERLNSGGTNAVTTFLLCFGILAMLVAALVIANTFQVLVAQRRRILALLRTIGAQSGQLYRCVVMEALLLGVCSSLLGVLAGIGIMEIIAASDVFASMGGIAVQVSGAVVAVPVLFGTAVTMLASLSSARSATKVAPLEALRPMESPVVRAAGIARAVVGLILLAGGLACAVGAAWTMHELLASDSGDTNAYSFALLTAIAGCGLIFLAATVTAVFWLTALMHVVGKIVSWAGPSATLAHANLGKNPRRVAATGTALLIGVTLVSCIATGALSVKQTVADELANHYSVDVTVRAQSFAQGSEHAVGKVHGVERALFAPTASGYVDVSDGDGSTSVSALLIGVPDMSELRGVINTSLPDVSLHDKRALMQRYVGPQGIEVKNGAITMHIDNTVGSNSAMLVNEAGDGQQQDAPALSLDVMASNYRSVSEYDATIFVSDRLFADGTVQASGQIGLLNVDDSLNDTSLSQVVQDVQQAVSGDDATVAGPLAQRMQWERVVDSMMMLLVGLLAVAVVIALIGVANTLSLSVIERTRECATLRAIGMTRGQVRRSLAVEALLIAVVSGIAGIALGTAFGWLGTYMVISTYGTAQFAFDWRSDLIIIGVSAAAALLASVIAAHRAVATAPVEALAEA